MRAISLLSLLGVASAFVPAPMMRAPRARAALQMSANDMIGVDTETGGLFDPAGFSKDEASLYRYRAVELKHGRVAMLAVLGIVTQYFVHLPDPVFSNPLPQAAWAQVWTERPIAIAQIILFLTGLELTAGRQDPAKAPGQLGRFGEAFKPEGEEEFRQLQLKELKNGRLAMVASLGMLAQEAVTGESPIGQLFSGHLSPFGDGQGAF